MAETKTECLRDWSMVWGWNSIRREGSQIPHLGSQRSCCQTPSLSKLRGKSDFPEVTQQISDRVKGNCPGLQGSFQSFIQVRTSES